MTKKPSNAIERFQDQGLSREAASTAVAVQRTLKKTGSIALSGYLVAQIADKFEGDSRGAVRAATILSAIVENEAIQGSDFDEFEFIDLIIRRLEYAGIGVVAEYPETLREFAREFGIDLSLGAQIGFSDLYDKMNDLSKEELRAAAENIGIIYEEDSDDIAEEYEPGEFGLDDKEEDYEFDFNESEDDEIEFPEDEEIVIIDDENGEWKIEE